MYRIRKSIDLDFAHHVRGHDGACINIHGHTWKFEVDLRAQSLDDQGFVVDFSALKSGVLTPCHRLLDHGFAVGQGTLAEIGDALATVGRGLTATQGGAPAEREALELQGAYLKWVGGIKVAVFPFSPTSERFAKWLFELATSRIANDRVQVAAARVYETLHPVEAVAEYGPDL